MSDPPNFLSLNKKCQGLWSSDSSSTNRSTNQRRLKRERDSERLLVEEGHRTVPETRHGQRHV